MATPVRPGPMLVAAPLTEADARAVASWRYEPPYDCYDFPAWAVIEREGWAIADAGRRAREFRSVRASGSDELLGCFWIAPFGDDALFSCGLGPEVCGRGLGVAMTQLALRQWKAEHDSARLWLRVRPFNRQAITAYRRAGFADHGVETRAVRGEPVEFRTMVAYRRDAGDGRA